jgi:hypothetical protein
LSDIPLGLKPLGPISFVVNYGKSPTQTIQELIEESMPNPWSVEDLYGNQVTRFSYDITAHQLRLMTQDLHKHVAQQIADHVESKIQEMLFNGSMEQFVKDAVEKEIRSQVKAAVAARLDDFLEDFLAD